MAEPYKGRDRIPGLGKHLRALRQAAGLTLADLAGRTGSHVTSLSKIEADERSPSFRLALALARALGLSVADLVPPNGKKKSSKKVGD
jgi:transcriptional regulator with XRE-family HTH domain